MELKFIADVMVGKLARWLRVLGFDTAYSNTHNDDEIVRIADAEHRVILTRDRGLAARRDVVSCILIESGDYPEQIRQVLRAFGLDLEASKVLCRCIECNVPLVNVDKESVLGRVPPYVYSVQEHFATCPSCRRVYWHGTHVEEMIRRITGI